ncbi:MAG: hypothetical protein ACPGRC_04780 [Salibacteraceae bacterium]
MRKLLVIFFVLGFTSQGKSQVGKPAEDIKLYYRSSKAYGLTFHTEGWGVSYKAQKHLSYKIKRIYNFEFQGLKHPKQEKVVNYNDNAKGYFFGKINALTNLRVGIGAQRAFALKEIKKGVQLAWVYSGGVNLGFVKPVYVEIYNDNGNPESVRYEPEIHTYGSVIGRASIFRGVDELDVVPGIYGKFGLNFEYSPYDEKLKSIEVGVAADLYYKKIPLMYNTYNNQYWITFYVMLEIGKKIE